MPDGCVFKASQWVLLSRTHAVAVIDLMQRVGRTSAHTSNDRQNSTANSSETLPVLSNALFSAFELVGKASDEMFFPSCLAIVGAIQPSPVEGDSSTSNNDTTVVTNTKCVYKQQVTYCDWTDNAKSPQEYSLFPTALVAAFTHYKDITATAKTKKQLETLHIHSACFLRKIKFPSCAKSDKEGSIEILNEAQTRFLLDWLPFNVHKRRVDIIIGSVGSSDIEAQVSYDAAAPACGEACLLDRNMERALDLYRIIAIYPASERVIRKRPLAQEDADFSCGTSNSSNYDKFSGSSYNDNKHDRYDKDSRYSDSSRHNEKKGRNDSNSLGSSKNHRNSKVTLSNVVVGIGQAGIGIVTIAMIKSNINDRIKNSNKQGRYYKLENVLKVKNIFIYYYFYELTQHISSHRNRYF